MMGLAARWVNGSYRGMGAKPPIDSSVSTASPSPGWCARRRILEQGQRMPRMKLSPTVVVAVASLIALGGQIQAAQDSQPKKPIAKQVAKQVAGPAKSAPDKAAKPHAAAAAHKKPAGK